MEKKNEERVLFMYTCKDLEISKFSSCSICEFTHEETAHPSNHRILQHSYTIFLELLQASWHRLVRLLATLLALAPWALVLADARGRWCMSAAGYDGLMDGQFPRG
jgi:hypothetical protein